MSNFNKGKPYHGSEAIMGGKLRGATDSDYFYFFCPRCPGQEMMRVLEYGVHEESPVNRYDSETKSKSVGGFTLVFRIHCEACRHEDFVKISNTGWQGGKFSELPGIASEKSAL